jgi:hypothetical protein
MKDVLTLYLMVDREGVQMIEMIDSGEQLTRA